MPADSRHAAPAVLTCPASPGHNGSCSHHLCAARCRAPHNLLTESQSTHRITIKSYLRSPQSNLLDCARSRARVRPALAGVSWALRPSGIYTVRLLGSAHWYRAEWGPSIPILIAQQFVLRITALIAVLRARSVAFVIDLPYCFDITHLGSTPASTVRSPTHNLPISLPLEALGLRLSQVSILVVSLTSC